MQPAGRTVAAVAHRVARVCRDHQLVAGLHADRPPVEVDLGSEFRYRDPLVTDSDLFVAISQSGETADTLAALREAKRKGARVLSVVNVVGSTISRESDGTVYTHAGPEIGVASTKAFTTQLSALILLAIHLGRRSGALDEARAGELITDLLQIPEQMKSVLDHEATINVIARRYATARDFLYLGRGINYPIALEGALKLKEISYIHAEGYPAGEMKHGPIALIDEEMPTVVVALKDRVYDKMISQVEQVKARKGLVLAVANADDQYIQSKADFIMPVPATHEMISPILAVMPLQILAYEMACRRGEDVDQPRNLAKSVTVE